MRGTTRIRLCGLVLVGLAFAIAMLALPHSRATPAGAQVPEPHYKCYNLPLGVPPPVSPVELKTEFGVEADVAIGPAAKLCLPAGENGLPIPNVPHLKCYSIAPPPGPGVVVGRQTEFGYEPAITVNQAKWLCVPATKTVVPEPPPPLPDPNWPHYKCYDIPSGPTVGEPVTLQTQFGVEVGLTVAQPTALCVPALKNGEGTLVVSELKCYTLTPPQSPPGRFVNLMTQFGPELNVEVGPPTMLCVPALGPVGGIAELPGSTGTTAEESAQSAGSGWSAGSYAALVGGLAMAAILIVGGGWYARRRLNRS